MNNISRKTMNTLTLTLSGMQNNMDGEINKKLERIMRILEWQAGKIQLLEREVEEDMELDIEEEVNTVREKKVKKTNKTRGETTDKMKPHEEGLYDRLCKWRRKQAVDDNVSAYLIFNNDQLERIAKSDATTISELLEIKGVGKIKSEKYGGVLLQFLSDANKSIF
jgi:ATP-dependent DNA helicase RecQ